METNNFSKRAQAFCELNRDGLCDCRKFHKIIGEHHWHEIDLKSGKVDLQSTCKRGKFPSSVKALLCTLFRAQTLGPVTVAQRTTCRLGVTFSSVSWASDHFYLAELQCSDQKFVPSASEDNQLAQAQLIDLSGCPVSRTQPHVFQKDRPVRRRGSANEPWSLPPATIPQ